MIDVSSRKLSLVVPVKDDSEYLKNYLIPSIKTQSHPPDEIIFVISTGDTNSIGVIQDFIASSIIDIRYIICNPRGIPDARQNGLENASYEYVAFTDADTVLSFDWVYLCKLYLKYYTMIYGKTEYISDTLPSTIYAWLVSVFSYTAPFHKMPSIVENNMAIQKSKALRCGGFNKNLVFGEGHDLSLRIGSYKYLPTMNVFSSTQRINTLPKLIKNCYYIVRYWCGYRIKEYKR